LPPSSGLATAYVCPSLLILFTLMVEVIHSFEMLVFTRATWHDIPEDRILQGCSQFCMIMKHGFMKNGIFWDVMPCGSCKNRCFMVSLRMASSGMLRHVAIVRTDVSEELSASFIRVTRIGELGTTLSLTNNRRTPYHYHLFIVPVCMFDGYCSAGVCMTVQ
jgi:hypothetical protein